MRPATVREAAACSFKSAAVSEDTLLLLSKDGALYAWSDDAPALSPMRGLQGVVIRAVGCGSDHCVALAAEGQVYAWGRNESGQLGVGDYDDREAPCEAPLPDGQHASEVSCAQESTLVLTVDGTAFSCGSDEFGQLGRRPPHPAGGSGPPSVRARAGGGEGGVANGPPPRAPGGPSPASSPISAATAEGTDVESASFARTALSVALGSAASDEECSEVECTELTRMGFPASVEGLLVQLALASAHGAALTSDGRVLTWGSAEGGRLGRPKRSGVSAAMHSRPQAIAIPAAGQHIIAVSAGGALSVAISATGALWLWGQLGRDVMHSQPVRARGEVLGSAYFLRVHASEWCTLAVAVPPAEEDEGDF